MKRTFALLSGLLACASATASAQRTSLWLEANGSHSRPPSGTSLEAASYGLFGARLRLDNRRSAFEFGATAGRGADYANGAWLSGRGAFETSRVRGRFDYGLHGDATGMRYLSPVRIGTDSEYEQSMFTGTLRPQAGVSFGGFRFGFEGLFTGGRWASTTVVPVPDRGPGLPLPGRDRLELQRTEHDGSVSVYGGSATLLRMLGRATVELRGSNLQATNQVAEGRYIGMDATVLLALGGLDVTAGGRYWRIPGDDAEAGGHLGAGFAIGERAYLQAIASHAISDPVYGTECGLGFSIGISVRAGGGGTTQSSIATVGAVSGLGRIVRFVFENRSAKSVAVAGDFTKWEPRTMQRGAGDTWVVELVIEPGVHHFSFIVDGDNWMVPDDAPGLVDDGWGRRNATVIVPPTERQATE